MNRLLSILILASITVCNLPGLNSPASNTLLTYLLRSFLKPAIEITIIYKGVSYKPGDTIELGSSDPYETKTISTIFRVTGTEPLSISSTKPYIIETTSNGKIELKSSSEPPSVWPVNHDQPLDVITTPDGELTNEWLVKLQITSPSVTELSYRFKLRANTKQSKVLVVSGSTETQSFVSTFSFDSTTGTLGIENPLEFGGVNISRRIATSDDKSKIYFSSASNSNIRGFRVGVNNSTSEISGSPFTYISGITNFDVIHNKNMLLIAETDKLHTIQYNSTTGSLGTMSAGFGTVCYSPSVTMDSKADYLIGSSNFYSSLIGQIQSFKVNTDGTLTGGPIVTNPDVSNNLGIHLKSKSNDYIFTATHTNTPGADNLKVSSILRRSINSVGSINNVDTYFTTLHDSNKLFSNFIAHPSDKYFYLIGKTTTPAAAGIIQVLNHDSSTGNLTFNSRIDIAGSIEVSNLVVSPDGKYVAALVVYTIGACPGSCDYRIKVYRINTDGSLSETQSFSRTPTSKLDYFKWAEF
jgi:hypothetical protein